ncbi:MAG: Ig-like domain-containing protein, partial [Polaribacter sp.]|uniref:Ig-like domain-containing protein n=1 Tax=Polaribacter sp. TaxID=1920175 RepID=UPI003BB11D31
MIKKNTLVYAKKAVNTFTLKLLFITLLSLSSFAQVNGNSVNYFEDFTSAGSPTNTPNGSYWMFYNEIHPTQDTWNKFIPGDGNAYVTVDADISNDLDWIHPYQALIFGGVGENHRLEVRMKGAVVDGGLVSFLFTYEQQGSTFNEVDLELVARDLAVPAHATLPNDGGWTDARFNTWRNANENTNRPFTGTKKAVVNGQNEKISLIDDEFHIYTIDWRSNKIDFFIDGVLQETITSNIATNTAEVIFGFRQLPWAGGFNWGGTHTMVIDYLKIEPLEEVTVAADDYYLVSKDATTDLNVLLNDSPGTTITSYDQLSAEGFPVSATASLMTYTSSGGFTGQDSFTYTITDQNGLTATATVDIYIEYVEPVNGVAFAKGDAITVAQNTTTNLDVLADNGNGADDFGTDGAADYGLTFLNGTLSGASEQGTVIVDTKGTESPLDDVITYTPKTGFTGVDHFYYSITDVSGDTSIA